MNRIPLIVLGMKRQLAILPILLVVPALPAGEPDLAEVARQFAEEMIAHGTDRWGREHSPQFASMLLRASPPELLPDAVFPVEPRGVNRMHVQNLPNIYKGNNRAHKITYRGGDVASDAGLYRLLYAISLDTGNARYGEAADASLAWFLANAPFHNGLLPWGEHSGWDFRRERADYGYAFDGKHEFDGRWPLWDRFLALQPQRHPGAWTVLENFSRGLWIGGVSEAAERLLYGRHTHLFGFFRPSEGEWTEFGMFPRHGGYYIDIWSTALAATVNDEFASFMEPRLERFIAALEQQTYEHGFAVYLQKQDIVFNPRQVGSLAVDLEAAADRLHERLPELSKRMRALAAEQDRAVTKSGNHIHPPDALRRADSNPTAAKAYLRSFFQAADRYLEPLPPRDLGEKVVDVTQPGRIPEQYADAIDVLLLARDRSAGDRARIYLEGATARAREAVSLFLPGASPLPRSVDHAPALLDGTRFPEFYSSYLGCDDLMWSLWRLAQAATGYSGH